MQGVWDAEGGLVWTAKAWAEHETVRPGIAAVNTDAESVRWWREFRGVCFVARVREVGVCSTITDTEQRSDRLCESGG